MELDMSMVSSDKLFRMGIRFKFQIIGWAQEILGKFRELMLNIKSDSMGIQGMLKILMENKLFIGRILKQ